MCGDCQICFHNWKFIGVLLYNATLESPNLFRQSDVLLISPNIFPAIFSAYTIANNLLYDQAFLYVLGDDSAIYTKTVIDRSKVDKLRTTQDLEVEFAIATDKIKQALCNSCIDVTSVIEQLQTISVVKNKNVPLLDEDVFENVTTVEKLWQRLSRFWSIYNYDMLTILLRIVKCKRADEIFEEFLSRIDVSAIDDMEIVAHYEVFRWQGLIKPLLRIKVKAESCTNSDKKKVEETLSLILNLKEYTLTFRGIMEGCIELIYEISNAMMSYFLQCKFTGYDLAEFAAHDIISIHINDMELLIPSKIDMVCKFPTKTSFCMVAS